MTSFRIWIGVLLASIVGVGPACAAEPPPLLPMATFFAPAEYEAPLISPDGNWISFVARYQNAFNIFVAPADNFAAAKPLTRETGRGIQWYTVSGAINYRWTPDSKHIVYIMDDNGNEHYRIYSASVETGVVVALTPGEKVRATVIALSPSRPDTILAAVDTRFLTDSHSLLYGFDLMEINVATGERKMVMENLEVAFIVADNDLKPRIAGQLTAELGIDLLKFTPEGPVPFYQIPANDMGGLAATGETQSLRVSLDNKTVYLLDSVGRDTVSVISLDLETGAKTVIATDQRVDIRDVIYDPTTNMVAAYGTIWTRLEWHATDAKVQADLDFLKSAEEGDWRITSRSADGRYWIVSYMLSDRPNVIYNYDSQARTMTKLFVSTPALEGLPLARMHPYELKSRDGRFDLVGYYVLPLEADPDQDGKPDAPAAMVTLIHGGPSDERAIYAYAPFVQWLANRGYGLLYVNFRGSAGFGNAFRNGQTLEWGGKMHDDVIDQVNWAIAQGIADPKRIAVLGGSYGGYATLIAMTKTPDVFACGVDVVGPSDLTVPMPHWSDDWIAHTLGDPKTPEGQALLRERSPVFFADRVKNPVLIGQGDRDTRVPTLQSDKMAEAMQAAGATVVYLLYPDEGHGFLRPENNFSFYSVTENFLARCLGGRAEKLTPEAFKGSSLIVKAGADYIPELTEAMAGAAATP